MKRQSMVIAITISFLLILNSCNISSKDEPKYDFKELLVNKIKSEPLEKQIKLQSDTAATFNGVTATNSAPKTNEKMEFDVKINNLKGNVYDPSQIDIYGEFISPKNDYFKVPAFYYEDYKRTLEPFDLEKDYVVDGWNSTNAIAVGRYDKELKTSVLKADLAKSADYSSVGKSVVISNFAVLRYPNVSFKVKGSSKGGKVRLGFSSVDGQSFYEFSPTADWQTINIPYSKFTPKDNVDAYKNKLVELNKMNSLYIYTMANIEASIYISDIALTNLQTNENFSIEKCQSLALSEYSEGGISGYEKLTKKEQKGFKIRFNPTVSGEWYYRVVVKENSKTLYSYTDKIAVLENKAKGFIHIEKTQNRNFIYEDGTPFVPIGENIGWYTSGTRKNYNFDYYFKKLKEHKANTARIFACHWQSTLVWNDSGILDFSNRLDKAYSMDKIIEQAQQNDIKLILSLFYHCPFVVEKGEPWQLWDSNPFNVQNGGYLKEPIEFFTNPQAIEDTKKLIRYMVARWGYSQNILNWELFNEISWVTGFTPEISDNWHREMANYIKSIDPFSHIVASSSAKFDDSINALPELDYINIHAYDLNSYSGEVVKLQREMYKKYKKPVLMEEASPRGTNGIANYTTDSKGMFLHEANWAGVMGFGIGGGLTWWWNDYVDLYNFYYRYTPIAKYVELMPIDFVKMPSLNASDFTSSKDIADAVGFKDSKRAYIWTYDMTSNYKKVYSNNFEGFTLTLKDMEKGKYKVAFFDTFKGEVISSMEIEESDLSLVINYPKWSRDIALIVEKQ